MPRENEKTAAAIAGSMEDMVNILRKASASGKKLKDTPENIAKHLMFKEHGSGSLTLDALRKPLRKLSIGKKIDAGVDKMQGKLADLDMKAGKKVHDVLTKNPKGKVRNALAKGLVQNHQIHLESGPKGVPDELLELQAAGLSNPLAKARDVALPVAGSFAIGNAISKSKNKEGDMVKKAYSREELIQKIAETIDSQKSDKVAEDISEDKNEISQGLFKTASVMLKFAAEKIKEYEATTEKLALENQRLYLENIAKERIDEATKLASEMNLKGFIKKADIEAKVDELSIMDEDAFVMFKSAVENFHSNNVEKDGVDSLTFMMDNNNIKYRKTLADSINESANEI